MSTPSPRRRGMHQSRREARPSAPHPERASPARCYRSRSAPRTGLRGLADRGRSRPPAASAALSDVAVEFLVSTRQKRTDPPNHRHSQAPPVANTGRQHHESNLVATDRRSGLRASVPPPPRGEAANSLPYCHGTNSVPPAALGDELFQHRVELRDGEIEVLFRHHDRWSEADCRAMGVFDEHTARHEALAHVTPGRETRVDVDTDP
jgi:hypothetical protein